MDRKSKAMISHRQCCVFWNLAGNVRAGVGER